MYNTCDEIKIIKIIEILRLTRSLRTVSNVSAMDTVHVLRHHKIQQSGL